MTRTSSLVRTRRGLLGAIVVPLCAATALAQSQPRQRAPGAANVQVAGSYLASGPYVLTFTLRHVDGSATRDSSSLDVSVNRSGGTLDLQTGAEDFAGHVRLNTMSARTNVDGATISLDGHETSGNVTQGTFAIAKTGHNASGTFTLAPAMGPRHTARDKQRTVQQYVPPGQRQKNPANTCGMVCTCKKIYHAIKSWL